MADEMHPTGEHSRAHRQEPRREDDRTALGYLEQLWGLARKWKVGFAGGTVLLGAISGGAVWLSAQLAIPPKIEALETKVDSGLAAQDAARNALRSELVNEMDSLKAQVGDNTDDLRMVKYLQCTTLRRIDPPAVPPLCDQIFSDWRRRR